MSVEEIGFDVRSHDGFQCPIEGKHVTHVSIALCPLNKFCRQIILRGPKLCMEYTAGSLVRSPGSLMIRFFKQTIVAGAFLFEQLLDFLICFIKPVLVFLVYTPSTLAVVLMKLWF